MKMFFGLELHNMVEINEGNIMSLFPIPAKIINIGRDFTENELQLFFEDIPMMKEEDMSNHQSVNLTLFDNFAEEFTALLQRQALTKDTEV